MIYITGKTVKADLRGRLRRHSLRSRRAFTAKKEVRRMWNRFITVSRKKNEKTLSVLPERLAEPVYMLFDYENRDLLDHQARVTEAGKC